MKRYILPFLACLIYIAVSAQTIQKGVVQEYNEKSKKTALPGVELNVYPAQSTVSGNDGTFQLEFLTLKPGERINVRRIEKAGYEIFNKEALEQWNFNPTTPFFIVMCSSDKFKQLKDLYFRNSEERYNRQYKVAQAELKKLREQNKIQQEEYIEKLRGIEDEYTKQLENLDNYVDRFARIDLSELSAAEQQIIELVQQGKIDEAIAKYEVLNASDKLLDNLKKRGEVKSAIEKLSEVDNTLSQANNTLYAVVRRQINTLQLAGGADNNRKIKQLYCEVADADTTNVEWLLKTADFMSDYMADYSLALHYYEQAFNYAERCYGPDHKAVATCYGSMGVVYKTLGEHEKALDCLNKSLDINIKTLGEKNADVALSLNNLGSLYSEMGKYEEALDYHLKALEVRKQVLNINHPDIAVSYNNIGLVYHHLNDFDKALDCYNMSLEILQQAYGPEHKEIATCRDNIGMVYKVRGEYEKSLDYLNKALENRLNNFGDTHPEIAANYNNIGTVYSSLDNHEKAVECYQKALETSKCIFGENHLYVATCYNNIGYEYDSLEDYTRALDYYQKALLIEEYVLGPKHPNIAIFYSNIGGTYVSQGKYEQALDCFKKSLSISEQVYGSEHLQIARTYKNIAVVYDYMNDYAKAIIYFQKALPILEKILGLNHPFVKSSFLSWLKTLMNASAAEPDYVKKISEFMRDKVWIGSVAEDSPAAAKGLTGEYYVLEFGDWKYDKDWDLLTCVSALQGKPKAVTLMKNGKVSRHDFDNEIGIVFGINKILPEEKENLTMIYEQWKSDMRK